MFFQVDKMPVFVIWMQKKLEFVAENIYLFLSIQYRSTSNEYILYLDIRKTQEFKRLNLPLCEIK